MQLRKTESLPPNPRAEASGLPGACHLLVHFTEDSENLRITYTSILKAAKKVTTTLNPKPHLLLISPPLFQRKEPHCSAQTHDTEDGSSWGPSLTETLLSIPAWVGSQHPTPVRVPSCPERSHRSSVCLGELPGSTRTVHPRWYPRWPLIPLLCDPGQMAQPLRASHYKNKQRWS